MPSLNNLVSQLDALLQPGQFKDYCPNGLQVQGAGTVQRLVSGVTACQALIDAAVDWDADAILVHHGYFWRGEEPCIVGMKQRRIAQLLKNDISLLAYHLPLDAHPELGNNAQLGRLLELPNGEALDPEDRAGVGNVAQLDQPLSINGLLSRLEGLTGQTPLHIGDPVAEVQRVAWCTGAAQSYIEQAVAADADVFITGEASEQTVHVARECGIHFIAAGHHATERYGVQAVAEHLAALNPDLEHRYIDIANPV